MTGATSVILIAFSVEGEFGSVLVQVIILAV